MVWTDSQQVMNGNVQNTQPSANLPSSLHGSGQNSISISNGRHIKGLVAGSEVNTISASNGQSLDPHARPYIPHALKFVNSLDGETISTRPLRQINFDAYVPTHIGRDFVPSIPPSSSAPIDAQFVLHDDVFHTKYESYFQHHLATEIQAQVEENDGYSLYEYDVPIALLGDHEASCTFLVPGLRENSPYLEEGDVVDIRQFVYQSGSHDPRRIRVLHTRPGRPLGLAGGYQGIGAGPPPYTQSNWTGIVFKARISYIHRKEEQLSLKIEGAKPHLLKLDPQNTVAGQVHCKFNIQFPVMEERYLPMQHVLPVIQDALKRDNRHSVESKLQGKMNSSICPTHRSWLFSMLCPTETDCVLQSKLNPGSFKRKYFDSELNWAQKKAVESICSQNYGVVPFLISGPPGTGKTKTLVETALQLVHKVDHVCHILFCAPSDQAADTLVQRLSRYCKPGELLRLNRTSRTFAEVPGAILPFCSILEDAFSLPPFRQLMKYKIVVSTTRDASMLMYARVTNSDLYHSECNLLQAIHPYDQPPVNIKLHWTALLIDEAAQAIEPEILIPLSIVAPPSDSVSIAFSPLFAMAGDEYQLGPRLALLNSPLKKSLLARLFSRPVYADHPLARGKTGKEPPALSGSMLPILRPPFANLICNYRSHPAILAVPSNLFYADTLEQHATDINRLSAWDGWNGKRWPVLFYNSSGEAEDDLEMDGGGWYNVIEAQIACRTAQRLVETGVVQQEEICIMSPFKAQVKCLRNIIKKPEYGALRDVDIGPTEVFQGLERGVVILCTTRSKARFVKKDQDLGWGIVGMPNQMNVALTRAKFGLVVIGKAEVLSIDENWQAFMSFCARNGLWEGQKLNGVVLKGEVNRLERVLLADEEAEVKRRRQKALKVWNRGHSSGMGDEVMWQDGVQAEEDDMGGSDLEEDEGEDEETSHYYDHTDPEASHPSKGVNGHVGVDDYEEDYEYHEALTGLRGRF